MGASVHIKDSYSPQAGSCWAVVWYPDAGRSEGPFELPQLRCRSQEEALKVRDQLTGVLTSVDPYDKRAVLLALGIRLLQTGFFTVIEQLLGPPAGEVRRTRAEIEAAFVAHPDWGPGTLHSFWPDTLVEASRDREHSFPWVVAAASAHSDELVFTPKKG